MMNFCTKCESYYRQPGTCNCFAGSQPKLWPFEPAKTIDTPTPYVPSVTTTLDPTIPTTLTIH